jgi:hypothetical protein
MYSILFHRDGMLKAMPQRRSKQHKALLRAQKERSPIHTQRNHFKRWLPQQAALLPPAALGTCSAFWVAMMSMLEGVDT